MLLIVSDGPEHLKWISVVLPREAGVIDGCLQNRYIEGGANLSRGRSRVSVDLPDLR